MKENKSVRISREELYKQVWTIPITLLAQEYKISDRGLSKICQRLNIPTPGRGYWARKAAGKNVIQYKLPNADKDTPREAVISEYGGLPQPNSETQASISDATAKNAQLIIPTRLATPHPVIKGWLDEYKQGRAAEKAEKKRDPFGVHFVQFQPFTTVDRRRHRLLHVLFTELEKQGYQAKSERFDTAYLQFQGIRVDFVLREKLKQERRPPTKKEESSYFYRDKDWVQELKPTGKLQFSIKTYIEPGLRHEWNETIKKSMEDHLPEIIAILTLAGPILVEQERQRQENRRRFQEEEQKRYERDRVLKKDQNQWQQFLDFAEAWQQAQIVRKFIAELEKNEKEYSQEVIGDRTIKEWLNWARDRVEKSDPMNLKQSEIFDKIVRVNTFSW